MAYGSHGDDVTMTYNDDDIVILNDGNMIFQNRFYTSIRSVKWCGNRNKLKSQCAILVFNIPALKLSLIIA